MIYGLFKLVLKLQIAYKDWSSNSFATTLLQKWNLVETTLMWKKIDSRQSRFKNIQLEGAYSERVVLKSLLSKPTIIFRWNTLCHLEIIIAWKFKILFEGKYIDNDYKTIHQSPISLVNNAPLDSYIKSQSKTIRR